MCNITFRFRPAEDESVDPEHEVLFLGTPSRLTIQCLSTGGYALVEHGFEDGELAWIKHLAFGRNLSVMKAKARALVRSP
jgi:hypothetical protein